MGFCMRGKAQKQPFQYPQRQVDELKAQIDAIQVTGGVP